MDGQTNRSGRALSILPVVLSIIAIGIAVMSYLDRDNAANRALRERELALIRHIHPQLKRMAADFDIQGYPENPQTLEEALDPTSA